MKNKQGRQGSKAARAAWVTFIFKTKRDTFALNLSYQTKVSNVLIRTTTNQFVGPLSHFMLAVKKKFLSLFQKYGLLILPCKIPLENSKFGNFDFLKHLKMHSVLKEPISAHFFYWHCNRLALIEWEHIPTRFILS